MDQIAYPNGDVDGRVVRFSREAGYRFGYGTRAGVLDQNGDRMLIPRLLVGGYDSPGALIFNINRLLAARVLA